MLVTAATGTVGQHVVRELTDTDVTVRVGSRDPAAAREQFDAGEFVAFDFTRPETWGAALAGSPAVFPVRPPGVSVDRMRGFVDALARVRWSQVAYLPTLRLAVLMVGIYTTARVGLAGVV